MHEGEKLELGQLKQEVIHAIQKPYIRLGGLEEFHHPKAWKAHVKKMVRERTNRIQSSVTYEISNEILEYLEPQVEKGNQHQLYKAMLNARPRHFNQWIEFDLGHLYPGFGLTGFHVRESPEIAIINEQNELIGKKRCERGDVYVIEHYHEEVYGTRDETTTLFPAKTAVALYPINVKTCLWSLSGQYIEDNARGQVQTFKSRFFPLMFLGDHEATTSNDISGLLERWSGGFNDYVCDIPENVNGGYEIVTGRINQNKYARLIAMMSLMNYDWFVEEPKVLGVQGKRLKKEITPHDSHVRVKLTLPKTKGRVIMPKEPKRTEFAGVRQHDVAGHWRHYKDEHGYILKSVYIKEHKRGDPSLGVITKDYVVEKDET
jgi:hypothetical protein|tara:strand:- start:1138 stop:2262 length:1125 start_codon:yes stop_codon:yes gene_type:complete